MKGWGAVAIVLVLGAVGAVYFGRARPAKSAVYVDAATCAGCHAAIAQSYARTGMGRSFHVPSASSIPEASYFHKASESYFTIQQRGGRFYQGRYQIGFDGKKTNLMEKPIDYVLGSGNHARTFLSRTSRNTLVELPLAWYAENGGSFGMNPGYDRADHPGFRRNVTYACAFCHNGYPSSASGTGEPVFPAALPEGIDCQRCHGPGSEHVRQAETGAKADDIRRAIVNPARLDPERKMEVCLQCHLETTSFPLPNAIVRYERDPFSYRPGEPLADFMLHFDQKDNNGKFEIVGAAYRLRESACFRKSEGKLDCTTCHNPHDIPRGESAAHYTQVCRTCHAASFDQLVAAGRHPSSNDCVGCHMPKRRTEDVVHVAMTDHLIQRRKPAGDLLAPLAERHITDDNGYRGPVELYYPAKLPSDPESELSLAVAQVSQKSNLKAGAEQLRAAIDKHKPARMEYYLHLAEALSAQGDRASAVTPYEEALRRAPQSPVVLEKFGVSLRESGDLPRAIEILKQAGSWQQLGMANLAQGSRADAIAAFEKAIAADPEMSEAYNSLGGARLENGEPAKAIDALTEAIRIQPDLAEAHSNLGNALAAAGKFDEARYHFEAALRLRPTFTAARFNYGLALARARRYAEAQRQMEQLPQLAEAQDLLGNLLVMQRQPRAALDHFREAVRLRPDFDRAHLDLGSLLADTGDVAGGLPHLQKAAQSPQKDVREEAAQILHQMGR